MRPDALNLVVRPRRPQEAADLGARLVQQHAAAIYPVWLALLLPALALGMALGMALEYSLGRELAILLLWWLKPFFDYGVLWVLSRAVFGETPHWRQLPRAIPEFVRQGLLGSLTWRRLSNSRSFTLPVRMLEGQSGARQSQRIGVLRTGSVATPRLLHQFSGLFEALVFFTVLSLALWFSPEPIGRSLLDPWLHAEPAGLYSDGLLLFYAIAMSVIEPFYVAAGFMLYLNRRTDLEAWDLEIALRSLADRLQQQQTTAPEKARRRA